MYYLLPMFCVILGVCVRSAEVVMCVRMVYYLTERAADKRADINCGSYLHNNTELLCQAHRQTSPIITQSQGHRHGLLKPRTSESQQELETLTCELC